MLLSDEAAASEAAPLISHNALKLAFCGGASGALAKTCTAPLARMTILYQVQALSPAAGGGHLGIAAAVRQVVQAEGLRSLWKGNLVTIIHRIPYSAVNFFTYETTKEALKERVSNDVLRAWTAGAVSGLVACTAAYPLDLLRTRMAAETRGTDYRRLLPALRRIAGEQGVRGLYKGLGATLVQVVPGLAFNFCFYDTFRNIALAYQWRQLIAQQPHQQQTGEGGGTQQPGPGGSGADQAGAAASPSPLASALCACAAGWCTSSLTFPLDVVRRRLQVYENGAQGRMRYGDVVRDMYRRGGLRSFYRGIALEYSKVLPGMAIAFTTYEALKRLTGSTATAQ